MVATLATNNTTVVYLDTRADGGANSVGFLVEMEPATATNASEKLNALKVVHADDTNQTSFESIVDGTTNATASSTQFVLPVQNDTANNLQIPVHVKTNGRKRYIGIVIAPGSTNGHQVGVIGFRSPRETPAETNRGAAVVVA